MTWLFDLLPWWTWLVSGLGLLGAAALVWFAPVLALELAKASWVLLHRALQTRIGCAALALLVGLIVGNLYGAKIESDACEARFEAAKRQGELDRVVRDTTIKAEIERQYTPVILDLQKQSDAMKKLVDEYEEKLRSAAVPAPQCGLGLEHLRLRNRK